MYRTLKILLISFVLIQLNAQELELGKSYQQYSKALACFVNVLNYDKNNSEAYYFLGKYYLIKNDIDSAEKYFTQGIEKNEDDLLNYVGMTGVALLRNDSTTVDDLLAKLIDQGEREPETFAELADIFHLIGNPYNKKGISFLTSPEIEFEKNDMFYLNLGNLYLSVNKASEARESYQNALDINKNLAAAYLGIGEVYLRINAYKDAEEYLKKALQVNSSFTPVYNSFADLYNDTKQYDKAVESYEKYLASCERDSTKLSKYATLLFLDKKYKEAIKIITENENQGTLSAQDLHILSYCYYYTDNYSEGIPAFLKYAKLNTSKEFSSNDYEFLGKLYEKSGKDSMAINCLLQAIDLDSTKYGLHGDIALIYIKDKKWESAAKHFKLKNEIGKNKLNIREYFEYGRALMLTKDFMDADSLFSKIILTYPDLPLAYLMKARARASIDTTSEEGLAKPYYENFIELAENSKDISKYKRDLIEAHSYLGYFYFLKKESKEFESEWKDRYRKNWNKVLILDPNNEQAQEAIKNIPKFKT